MKFERLTVPNLPLPDLVAFNERVHGIVDPWWARVWVRRVAWTFAALFTLFAAMWIYFASGLPSSETLLAYQPPLPTNVRGYDGAPVQTFARERRVDLSYDEVPPLVVQAFISAEDKNFFSHHGLDVTGLIGAVAAYVAVLPRAPANYDPGRATRKALDRRNYVLREMSRNGYLSEDQWKAAAATPLGAIRYGSNEKFHQQGGYFMEEVRRELMKRFGEEANDGPNSLYGGGLWVRSSMDPVMQDAAAQALRDGLTRFDGGRGWTDLGMRIDITKDWAARLDAAPVGTGYPDWRKAVVLNKGDAQAAIGFTNGTTGVLNAGDAATPKRGVGGR